MATYRILYWRDIPSAVEASDGRDHAQHQLSERFQELIDVVALRLSLDGADEYLEQWRRGGEEERPGTAQEVAEVIAAEIEGRFEEYRDRGLGRP